MDHSKLGFSTRQIHAGMPHEKANRPLAMPIYATSTFAFESAESGGRIFAGEEDGYIYTRLGNPNHRVIERKLADLEGAEAAVTTASGMGAVTSALWTLLRARDHMIADKTLYGCTFAYLSEGISRYGVEVSFVNCSNPEEVEKAIRPNTKAIYFETPANPNLRVVDIRAISDIAHAHDIKVIVDNTFSTPYLQRPLEHGADIVIHSATKFLNGHGDVIAGFVVGKADYIHDVLMFGVKDMTGSVLGPFEAFLLLRGMKTLSLRMERHEANARAVAEFLHDHPMVQHVYYPGLPDDPYHEVAKKQMSGFGAVVAFEVKGGKPAGIKLIDSCELCTIAVSLGDVETLIQHPASMTHSTYSPEELEKAEISPGLVRIAVGLEDAKDIIADLDQALSRLS